MGKLITLDNTVCYLTPLLDGRVYVLPRRILDPELGPLATPLISTEYPIPDNQAAGHLRQGRWEKDFGFFINFTVIFLSMLENLVFNNWRLRHERHSAV